MKRFSKIKSKKGFTLLETLLATCILVIVASMLMEGFITAMGYSYNSSVYARSAAFNNQLCLDKLASWSLKADGVASMKADGASTNPEASPYKDVATTAYAQTGNFTSFKEIVFTGDLGVVKVAVHEEKDVNTGAGNLSRFTAEKIRSNPNAVADNRMIFFYYPTVVGNPTDTYFGNTHLYRKADGTVVWGYDKAGGGVEELGDKEKKTVPDN